MHAAGAAAPSVGAAAAPLNDSQHDQRQAYRPCKERDGHKKAIQDKCEFIFFLDSDILVEPGTLLVLYQANMPIISAVYYSRAPPYEMAAQIGGRGLSHEMAGQDQVREVEEVGTGCCRSVLSSEQYSFFSRQIQLKNMPFLTEKAYLH
jgi:hypothetical protein